MNYHLFIKTILSFLFCLSILSGCKDDRVVDNNSNVGEVGMPVRVDLKFNIPGLEIPPKGNARSQSIADTLGEGWKVTSEVDKYRVEYKSSANTRADEEESETQTLLNLWILQFGPDKKVRKVIQVPNTPDPVHETATIDAELFTGENQTIYLVVLGKQYSAVSLSAITSIAELESYSLPAVRYVNGIAMPMIMNAEDVPYSGSASGLNIISYEKNGRGYIKYDPSTEFTGAIHLNAMVSKVTFNFSYKVDNLTPYLLMLNNVPADYTIVAGSDKPTKMINFPAIELTADDFAGGKRYEVSWYMPANKQGVVSTITQESSRYFYYKSGSTSEGTAPQNGTYINLWASDSQLTDNYALYYIFLGSNTTNDFNIYPNSHYKLRSDINIDPSANDKRVIYKQLKQTIDILLRKVVQTGTNGNWSNDGMLHRSGQLFNPHAGMQPVEVTALRGLVKIEVLASGSSTTPIPNDDSWLHLSMYPNYTEAYNQNKAGDSNALTSTLTLDVPIPQLFKLYLYNDEWEDYTETNPGKEENIRKLYLRFTFQTPTGISKKYVCELGQSKGFYLGQFGGERNLSTGVYTEGLVGEYVEELALYPALSYHTIPYKAMRGSYVLSNYRDMLNLYDSGNLDNGKKTTLLHSININASSTNKIAQNISARYFPETPIWRNGKVDLYQYKNHLFNSFAIRMCYDRNRDENGNGVIDEEEYNWYMPSYYQVIPIGLNHPNAYTESNSTTMGSSIGGSTLMTATTQHFTEYYSPIIYNMTENNFSLTGVGHRLRCVRNIKLSNAPTNENRSVKVFQQDGYAVIDASGLSAAVDKTPGGDYVDANGRTIRHNISASAYVTDNKAYLRVSARFMVSPTDIDSLGIPAPTYDKLKVMTWAAAAGYNTAGNNLPITEKLDPAATGCGIYKGKNGSDTPGTWRLPNTKEILLIDMMEKAMASTSSVTGYVPLFSPSPGYWTSTEGDTNDTRGSKAVRLYTYEYTSPVENAAKLRQISAGHEKIKNLAARCIRDLP